MDTQAKDALDYSQFGEYNKAAESAWLKVIEVANKDVRVWQDGIDALWEKFDVERNGLIGTGASRASSFLF